MKAGLYINIVVQKRGQHYWIKCLSELSNSMQLSDLQHHAILLILKIRISIWMEVLYRANMA